MVVLVVFYREGPEKEQTTSFSQRTGGIHSKNTIDCSGSKRGSGIGSGPGPYRVKDPLELELSRTVKDPIPTIEPRS